MREDWIECKFDDVFFTTSGGTPSRRNENYYIGNIPWIKSGELKSNVITEAEEFISEEAVKNSSAKVFPTGTILLALYGATIGKIAILGIPAATNQAICGIFETPFVFSKYAYYFLVNKKSYLIKQGIGGAQPNISQTILKNLDFSLPPLPEQRAIVKKLESLFSSLDAGVADLKKAQQQLKIYRQAVLKKAFDSNGEFVRIGEYFSFLGGGTPSKQNKDYWNGNINWASIKDIKGDILNNTIDYITEDGLKNSSSNLAEKDEVILATRINPGKTIISNIRTAINQDLKVIKPFQKCDFKYVHYLFKSIEHKCLKVSSGTTVLGISLSNLKEIEISFDNDIHKQAQIVKQIESRLSVCDSIEQNIKESLVKAEALRQSILKKAFEGNLLTAQELAACKQAADYEPASVLLQRIRNEKLKIRKK